ncbi:hypothetical protein PIB30_116680 [Stylosanthes scabra]|uniref:Uncharacterized protein n=1 Tax=Stylosanthes scabra TaxID=79078 RepID=A0ABU6TAL6_9FABA|nr:hypothetical protein [Stylosanthes scabra]
MSDQAYPTSNLYFMQVWRIKCLLKENANSPDEVIREMVRPMQYKFDKYWEEYSMILSLGAVLDARIKFQLLNHCFNRVDSLSSQEKVTKVKKKLYLLFQEYTKFKSQNNVSSSNPRLQSAPWSFSKVNVIGTIAILDELKNLDFQFENENSKSSLNIYLDEHVLHMNTYDKMDILQYWMTQSHRFPDLSILACDLLSIPITTIASESAFSIGAHILNKYRNCLLHKNMEALMCARSWIRGFDFEGDY